MNMPTDAFLTTLYVIVDDWYQLYGPRLLAGKAGAKPRFSDSEVLTLSLAQHWCGFATEREWLRFINSNHRALFPRLVSQSEFNTRARNLCWVMNQLHRFVLEQLGVRGTQWRLIDSTPVVVRHWRRYGSRSLAPPGAALGFCAAKKEYFYGYRLLALTTLEGIITDWVLIPANADERDGADELLEVYQNLLVLGDKGFLDQVRQACLLEKRGIHLQTPKRKNQKQQNPKEWDALHTKVRQRIETAYSQAKAFLGLEKPGAKTLWGLFSRLIAKLTGMALAAQANLRQGCSPLRLAEFTF
jgi:hypothetical protein